MNTRERMKILTERGSNDNHKPEDEQKDRIVKIKTEGYEQITFEQLGLLINLFATNELETKPAAKKDFFFKKAMTSAITMAENNTDWSIKEPLHQEWVHLDTIIRWYMHWLGRWKKPPHTYDKAKQIIKTLLDESIEVPRWQKN
jgi:hypothetical protein